MNISIRFQHIFFFLLLTTFVVLTVSAQDDESSKDGNVAALKEKQRQEREAKPSFSERYRERFNTENYRERYGAENYRESAIEEGFRRRRERFSGDIRIHFDSHRAGANLQPSLDQSHNYQVHTDENTSGNQTTFFSTPGVRVPINAQQKREIDPHRKQQLRSLLTAPSLLQRYTGQIQSTTYPVQNPRQGYFPNQPNAYGPSNQSIPPINQPRNQPQRQSYDLHTSSQSQGVRPPVNRAANAPAQHRIQRPAPVNQNGVFLPYPLSRYQSISPTAPNNYQNQRENDTGARSPAAKKRYQTKQNKSSQDVQEKRK